MPNVEGVQIFERYINHSEIQGKGVIFVFVRIETFRRMYAA